LENISLLFPY